MAPPSDAYEFRLQHAEQSLDRLLSDYHDGPQGEFGVRTKVLLMWHAQLGVFTLAGAILGWIACRLFGG